MALPFNKQWLVDRYLTGLDLTDDNGNEYAAAFYTHAINSAISWIQAQLDLPVVETDVVERHDYDLRNYQQWQWLGLGKLPVQVSPKPTVRYKYNDFRVVEIPEDWIYLAEPTSGQLQIVPTMGSSLPLVSVIGGMPVWAGISPLGTARLPGWFEVEYRAGWADDEIPYDIQHLLGMFAARFALNTAGDLIAGAGVASFSIGVDGIHNSLSTTSSATNAGYGARILQYEKEMKDLIPLLRRRYHGAADWEIA
jgi:hypothetical protein